MGLGLGPIIGTFFYYLLEYLYVFLIEALFILVVGDFFTYFFIPDQNQALDDQDLNGKNRNLLSLLQTQGIFYLSLTLIMNFGAFTFITTDFENYMLSLGGSVLSTSLCLAMVNASYLIILFIIDGFRQKMGGRKIFIISFILIIISLFLVGHETFFILDKKVGKFVLIGFGMFILGFGLNLSIIIFIPECIEVLSEFELNEEEKSEIMNNYVSLLYLISFNFSKESTTFLLFPHKQKHPQNNITKDE